MTGVQTCALPISMEKLYKSQQNGFIASGDVEAEVPVSDYVMFDLMLEATK